MLRIFPTLMTLFVLFILPGTSSTCSDSVSPESPEGSHPNHLPPPLHPLSEYRAFLPHLFLPRIKEGNKQAPCSRKDFHLKSLYCNYTIVNMILLKSTSGHFHTTSLLPFFIDSGGVNNEQQWPLYKNGILRRVKKEYFASRYFACPFPGLSVNFMRGRWQGF